MSNVMLSFIDIERIRHFSFLSSFPLLCFPLMIQLCAIANVGPVLVHICYLEYFCQEAKCYVMLQGNGMKRLKG